MKNIICRECGGIGCQACSSSGYAEYQLRSRHQLDNSLIAFADIDVVPMPYGKILPDLTDAYYLTEPFVCPSCGSNHTVGLSEKHNPNIVAENISPSGRWFCISCQDSWCYEREH